MWSPTGMCATEREEDDGMVRWLMIPILFIAYRVSNIDDQRHHRLQNQFQLRLDRITPV